MRLFAHDIHYFNATVGKSWLNVFISNTPYTHMEN